MNHFYESVQGWFDPTSVFSLAVNLAPPNSTFVEVGSWKGRSTVFTAVELINSGKPFKFYAVDHWEKCYCWHDWDTELKEANGDVFGLFTRNIAPVSGFVTPIRKSSVEAAKDFADKSVFFDFLDADHTEEGVTRDIDAWLPKIQPGGILAGHDYTKEWAGVIAAVKRRFGDRGFFVEHTTWWIQL